MKLMMRLINSVASKLTDEMAAAAKDQGHLELKALFGKFSMDTIASCGFGVEANSFEKGTVSPFVANAKDIFHR